MLQFHNQGDPCSVIGWRGEVLSFLSSARINLGKVNVNNLARLFLPNLWGICGIESVEDHIIRWLFHFISTKLIRHGPISACCTLPIMFSATQRKILSWQALFLNCGDNVNFGSLLCEFSFLWILSWWQNLNRNIKNLVLIGIFLESEFVLSRTPYSILIKKLKASAENRWPNVSYWLPKGLVV